MKKIEILAPAGSLESLKAAIHASCDAIYIGGNKFGARAYADNLSLEDMLWAIDYAHIHEKQIYLTVNTLLKQDEIEKELYDYIRPFYLQGIDAVIVQDVGALYFIHKHFPDLDIHASTQMSLTMAEGGEALRNHGITRMVNARELSLEEIRVLRKNTDLEIESFVHGALCYCYSGQCLMSSMFGGRSGNRGRCAQPCRMPYNLKTDDNNRFKKDEKYLLSPKDISTIDILPDLIDAGINSFKIEGRMKRPEYAAGVTYTYRKYVDKYLELGRERYESYRADNKDEFDQDMMNLKDLYNRGGFSTGYYTDRNGSVMMSVKRPNHSGVLVGEVKEIKGSTATIKLKEDIYPQDILEIRSETENIYEFTVKNKEEKNKNYTINFSKGLPVKPNLEVYRTKSNTLLDELYEKYLKEQKKENIAGHLYAKVNEPLVLELSCRDIGIKVYGDIVQQAMNQPMTKEKLLKQISKTSESNYNFELLDVTIDGDVFVPVIKLNELRRDGLIQLEAAIADSFKRDGKAILGKLNPMISSKEDQETEVVENQETDVTENQEVDCKVYDNISGDSMENDRLGVHVLIETMDQLNAAIKIKEVNRIYIESDMVPLKDLISITSLIKDSGKQCYIKLPNIMRNSTYKLFLQYKTILVDNTIDGYLLRNFEEYTLLTKEFNVLLQGKDIITDYNMYVMNKQAKEFWNDLGISKFTCPLELNGRELRHLQGIFNEMIVYGKIPLMVSAQCLVKNAVGGRNTNFNKTSDTPCCDIGLEKIELIDRYQKGFTVKRHCRDCYNTIYNSDNLSLLNDVKEVNDINVKNIRLCFTTEGYEECVNVIHAFVDAYVYKKQVTYEIKNITRGHFRRGIL